MAKSTRFNLKELISSIDKGESTDWANDMLEISTNIRNSLLNYLSRSLVKLDENFWDYCNCIKSLLIMYNFGSLDKNDPLFEEGRQRIKEGVVNVLNYVGVNNRYDISGSMLSAEDCQGIFTEDGKCIPVIVSLTSVFTTLIYLRRAMKRNDLFTVEELNEDNPGLYDKIVETVGDIMVMLQDYVSQNGFKGWGFTVKSKQVTLSDTYAVVDAISRYLDAFTKDGKEDKEFTDAVDKVQEKKHGEGYKGISDWLISSMYKVAFTTYDNAKDVYGQSIFYANGNAYSLTDIEQISNSNRSSALFNPLYVAMITMYGYNDKEIVIRRFMDDYALVNKIYKKYEVSEDGTKIGEISAYLEETTVEEVAKVYKKSDFVRNVEMLKKEHAGVSYDYSDNAKWKSYYQIARVFQKFLEVKHKQELFKISEYRDYYNATKDAIDQVQVMYRKFDDKQKLGIVDTDYMMFSRQDIDTESVNISKLNKANIAVNSLRPLLLSSKIMIVSALTNYPQADMMDLYIAIKETRYRKSSKSQQEDWLWNEDKVDMNSTMRHCETIAYDYFDYYESYELGYKAISNLKNNASEISIDVESGTLTDEKSQGDSSDDMNVIKKLIMDMTRLSMAKVNDAYRAQKEHLQKEFEKRLEEKELEIQKQKKKNEELENEFSEKRKQLKADTEMSSILKEWIRDEAYGYLSKMLSYIVLKKINGNSYNGTSYADDLSKSKIYDGDFSVVKSFLSDLKDEYKDDKDRTQKEYSALIKRANDLQELFEASFDGILDLKEIKRNVESAEAYNDANIERANAMIQDIYRKAKKTKNGEDEGNKD